MLIAHLFVAAFITQPVPSVTDLSWLTGCWSLTTPSRTITEFWLPPAGGTMMGMSRTVANNKTVEYEFIVLRSGTPGLEYVAKPSGQAETIFKATRVSADEAVFENPAHDFPTRITYRRGNDAITATIDGIMNGTPRAIDFKYQRGDCSK